LQNILSIFGANKRPFVFQEVIDLGGEPIKNSEYSGFARVTEFKYGMHLSDVSLFFILYLWSVVLY